MLGIACTFRAGRERRAQEARQQAQLAAHLAALDPPATPAVPPPPDVATCTPTALYAYYTGTCGYGHSHRPWPRESLVTLGQVWRRAHGRMPQTSDCRRMSCLPSETLIRHQFGCLSGYREALGRLEPFDTEERQS
jgi:hypothetical protein